MMRWMVDKVAALAFSLVASAGCAQERESPAVEIIKAQQLAPEKVELMCDRRKLDNKIDEKRAETKSSEYETMLSFARRDEGDGFSQLMSNKSLRDRFKSGVEGAVFISQDFQTVAVATFPQPANVNTFLKGVSACSNAAGNVCIPALYYDGADAFCLLFTKTELGG